MSFFQKSSAVLLYGQVVQHISLDLELLHKSFVHLAGGLLTPGKFTFESIPPCCKVYCTVTGFHSSSFSSFAFLVPPHIACQTQSILIFKKKKNLPLAVTCTQKNAYVLFWAPLRLLATWVTRSLLHLV